MGGGDESLRGAAPVRNWAVLVKLSFQVYVWEKALFPDLQTHIHGITLRALNLYIAGELSNTCM